MNERIANRSNLNAIDHLGRELPHWDEVREKQENKIVGLFYYLWLGYHGTQGPYDITKILEHDPNAMQNLNSPAWPDYTNAPMLFWGEPMYGYYVSTDEWVLRRHVQLFIDAGIDVLFFDATNGFTYKKAYTKLFDILTELQEKGFEVPKVCFYLAPITRGCGTGNMMTLWEDLYEPGLYSNLWFYWKGKPLLICHSERSIPDKIRAFFTWRSPTWQAPDRPNTWAWEGNPQKVSVDENGNPEEIAINVCKCAMTDQAGNVIHSANMSDACLGISVHGRSFHDGKKDMRENASHYGFHFQEQMDFALKADPPVAFLCQWNEWLVPFLTTHSVNVPNYDYHGLDICFRDEFNEEYSRDIEPMKGGYRDAYYLQMVSFVRKFKGMTKPAIAHKKETIEINSDFSQWTGKGICYYEYTGDVAPRNSVAYDAVGRYTNNTGRNEFQVLKVASDEENIYFYVRCTGDITPPADHNWMTLLIRNPKSSQPSWNGYQYAVNRIFQNNRQCQLEKCGANQMYCWQKIGCMDYLYCKNEMHLKIPKSMLDISGKRFSLEFKWSDHMQNEDVMDFYVNGDAAPRGRMNYVYYFQEL